MALISQLESVMLSMLQQSLAARVAITLVILAVGFGLARVGAHVTRYLWMQRARGRETVERIQQRRSAPDRAVSYVITLLTLAAATLYINASAANQIMSQVAAFVPRVMTAVLVFLLGVVLVRGLMGGLRVLARSLEVREYAESLGVSTKLMDAFFAGIAVFLYLVVVELAVVQLGVSPQIINSTLTATSYGVVLLLVLLGFFGFRNLIQNYAAGIYLRGSDVLRPGKRVKVDGQAGEIRDISVFGTTITTDSGYFMLTPNQRLMDTDILFKRVKADVETLEDIKDYFVAERSAQPGAAVGEMALAIFGFDITQGDISEEMAEDDGPEALGAVLERLTEQEVRTAVVPSDKIADAGTEFKTWFNNGALLLPYFSKGVLFPAADADQYVLCVGVEGDEVLIVDPTNGDSGGVYFVESSELQRAMNAPDDGGYLVLAPRGTTAFWRIKNELIYSNLSFYKQLSKSLEVQLGKILRRGDVLKQVVPESVNDFIERWTAASGDDHVVRMWAPENGETKIDEFTDNS